MREKNLRCDRIEGFTALYNPPFQLNYSSATMGYAIHCKKESIYTDIKNF